MYLSRVANTELDIVDQSWLTEIVELLPFGNTIKGWMEDTSFQFWRVASGGLVVTQVWEHPTGKEFRVVGLAGRRFKAKALRKGLDNLAAGCGARWWGAEVVNPGVAQVLAWWGLSPRSVNMLKEV